MGKWAKIPDHCLSVLITYVAVSKPALGHYTDKESALLTWCYPFLFILFGQKATESLIKSLGPKVQPSTWVVLELEIFGPGVEELTQSVYSNFRK